MEKVSDSVLRIEEYIQELGKRRHIEESDVQKLLDNFFVFKGVRMDLESMEMLYKKRKNLIKFLSEKNNISTLTVEEKIKSNQEIINNLFEGLVKLLITVAKSNQNPYLDFLETVQLFARIFHWAIYFYMADREVYLNMKEIARPAAKYKYRTLYAFVESYLRMTLEIIIEERSGSKTALIGKRGGRYIERVSKNGNRYRKYY